MVKQFLFALLGTMLAVSIDCAVGSTHGLTSLRWLGDRRGGVLLLPAGVGASPGGVWRQVGLLLRKDVGVYVEGWRGSQVSPGGGPPR